MPIPARQKNGQSGDFPQKLQGPACPIAHQCKVQRHWTIGRRLADAGDCTQEPMAPPRQCRVGDAGADMFAAGCAETVAHPHPARDESVLRCCNKGANCACGRRKRTDASPVSISRRNPPTAEKTLTACTSAGGFWAASKSVVHRCAGQGRSPTAKGRGSRRQANNGGVRRANNGRVSQKAPP